MSDEEKKPSPFDDDRLNEENMLRAQGLSKRITELLNEELAANTSKLHAIANVMSALSSVCATTVVALRIQPAVFAQQFMTSAYEAFNLLREQSQIHKLTLVTPIEKKS